MAAMARRSGVSQPAVTLKESRARAVSDGLLNLGFNSDPSVHHSAAPASDGLLNLGFNSDPSVHHSAAPVLSWAGQHGRDLPWRHTRDPWAVLVSEVMAQQTQVHRVIPKWLEFLERWPTPQACAASPLGDVLRLWEGLGYPRRAKHLHQAAQLLAAQMEENSEGFPRTLDTLLLLPGVGDYTARAVLAFAFEADVAVVDTNTARLLARWANRTMNRFEVQAAADAALPDGQGWAWNQAMLDLGALVCTRTDPNCDRCPVAAMCAYGIALTGSDPPPADPATGTAGVSLPQSRFAGSDRQFRGRVLRLAAQGSRVDEVAALVGLEHDPQRASRLIQSLVTDGLMELVGGRVKLPGN